LLAPILALAMAAVWLVGSCGAFAATLEAAQHACCDQDAAASDSCRTLCAAAEWDSAPAGAPAAVEPPAPLGALPTAQPATPGAARRPAEPARAAPPLYLQHAAFLI